MNVEELFQTNLGLIDRVIDGVRRRSGLRDADAEDFASTARLALMENDYAVLRAHERGSSLATFLTIVVQRLLSAQRARMWGRWHRSAEAERLGDAAVLLEKLLVRDHRSLDESVPIVLAVHPSLDRASLRELAARLPQRAARLRLVALEEDAQDAVATDRADARADEAEARRTSMRAARIVRETLARLPLEDRMLVRFRFGASLSIADVARLLGVPQRPLYRRIEALLRQLRVALERGGVSATAVHDVISAAASEGVDFGLDVKSDPTGRTREREDLR
jgi:RNA polymerase sigma factor (sigma-70 family)